MGTSRAIQCEIEIDTAPISPASEKRRPSLTLEIPPRSGIAKAPSSGSGRSSAKKSVQFQSAAESNTLNLGFKRLLTPRSARTASLPLQFASPPSSSPSRENLISASKIKRSKSAVEGQTKSKKPVTRVYSGTFLVKSSTPRPRPGEPYNNVDDAAPSVRTDAQDNGGEEEEIPVEEAVCRICLCELGEEGSALKLECQCKGDLALAHEECALKWFGIRGNRECDVCCYEVVNLPVTLTRIQQAQTSDSQQAITTQSQTQARNWHDVPLLVMVSIITYFLLLDVIVARRVGSRARLIALPFSIIFGMFTSISATILAKRRWMLFFAIFQLAYVVLSAHVFLNWMRLNPVLSMSLAGFAGFGLSMMFYAVLLEYCTRSRGANTEFYSA